MSLIRPSRCLPLECICSRKRLRVAGGNCPLPASINSSEKPRIALSGVRSSWLMLARKTLLWRLASPSFTFACLMRSSSRARSSEATTADMNCCTRLSSSVPKPGVNGPDTTTRRPGSPRLAKGSDRIVRSMPAIEVRLTPSDRCGRPSLISRSAIGSMPRDAIGTPCASNAAADPPPTSRIAHSSARPARVTWPSLSRRRSSMNARRPSSSEARHSRRSQAGGEKLT